MLSQVLNVQPEEQNQKKKKKKKGSSLRCLDATSGKQEGVCIESLLPE